MLPPTCFISRECAQPVRMKSWKLRGQARASFITTSKARKAWFMWFFSNLELQKRYNMIRGCPFGTMGSEVTENDELIRQDLCLIFEVIRHKLIAFFIKEKAKFRLSEDAIEND